MSTKTEKHIINLLNTILVELELVKKDVARISQQQDKMAVHGNRMNSHISNVEDIYNKVRVPLSWVKNKVNNLISNNDEYNDEYNDDENLLLTINTQTKN